MPLAEPAVRWSHVAGRPHLLAELSIVRLSALRTKDRAIGRTLTAGALTEPIARAIRPEHPTEA